jgi:hypothetical protein
MQRGDTDRCGSRGSAEVGCTELDIAYFTQVIQLLLGHASIQTMGYLGTRRNLAEAVNDRLGLMD